MENFVSEAHGIKTWLKNFTPSGIVRFFGEGLIPSYGEQMKVVRRVDDIISKEIDSCKNVVKAMKTALNGVRYVDVALLLEEYHNKLNSIFEVGADIKEVEEQAIKEFEQKSNIRSSTEFDLVKNAGLWDDLKRKWIYKKFENKFRLDRKKALENLVGQAELFQAGLQNLQSNLGTARAQGNIGQYIQLLSDLNNSYTKFKNKIEPVYNQYLLPLLTETHQAEKEYAAKIEEEAAAANEAESNKLKEIENKKDKEWEELGNNLPPVSEEAETAAPVLDTEIEPIEPYKGEFEDFVNPELKEKKPEVNILGEQDISPGEFKNVNDFVSLPETKRKPGAKIKYDNYLEQANKLSKDHSAILVANAYASFIDEISEINDNLTLRESIAAFSSFIENIDENAAEKLLKIALAI